MSQHVSADLVVAATSAVAPENDLGAFQQTQEAFKGFARLNISLLDYALCLSHGHRELLPSNVDRLEHTFRLDRCRRRDEDNCVVGLVDHSSLAEALHQVDLNEDQLRQTPAEVAVRLPLRQVHCLHGMHRLEAARRVLEPNDQWWTVRLYVGNAFGLLCPSLLGGTIAYRLTRL